MTYEDEYAWEKTQGSIAQRTFRVSADARQCYSQLQAAFPALQLDHPTPDLVASEHVRDVGRRVLILRENAKKPDKVAQKVMEKKEAAKHVIPPRFAEEDEDREYDDKEDEAAVVEGRIATMLLDQEWDTRTWNQAKIRAAIETLYSEIENSDQDKRRELATTMLIRLLETHEDAVDIVEATIPILMNKGFRSLSKITNQTKIFRVACLLSVLAQWFAPLLSRENAAMKCIGCLLHETEVCARILQHHWRGALFERKIHERNYDASVRGRLRAMHLVKLVELRHQFKVVRNALGPQGLPDEVVKAYITILLHLVKSKNYMLTDQRKIVGSGVLVFLASLITKTQQRETIEMVKEIIYDITKNMDEEKAIDILKCNIVQRVTNDIYHVIHTNEGNGDKALSSSLRVLAILAEKVSNAKQIFSGTTFGSASAEKVKYSPFDNGASSSERLHLMKKLENVAAQFLIAPDVLTKLLQALNAVQDKPELCVKVLEILRLLAQSFGFRHLLDELTRSGGRSLHQVILCFDSSDLGVVSAAVALFYEMTSYEDARNGFTTAGAIQQLMKWCNMGIENTKSPSLFVLSLIGCALLARQTNSSTSPSSLMAALGTLNTRLDALNNILLEIVVEQTESAANVAERAAMYFHSVNMLSILVRFLAQVSPSSMESPYQNARQRNISCIVLSRFFRVPQVAISAFSESVIEHLALSLQCNHLDEIERLVARMSSQDRHIHQLGSKEICKALSRLARCPSDAVDARLKPSLTSSNVPNLPQAMICDVMFRHHALEDLISLIRYPNDAAEFEDLELGTLVAAVELAGYLRPLPFGEEAREQFLRVYASHQHGKYALEKLMQLVDLVAPAILHVLRDKRCCYQLVSICCASLSRLGCANAAVSRLLTQGCISILMIHLPEVLLSFEDSAHQSAIHDSSVDDHRLLDVPSSMYTLIGKLCAVAEGRTAIMKAQLMARLLKRLQLQNTSSKIIDEECKSEIAVVIARLAMVNTIEGNTSELFLHFHVVEVLANIVRPHGHVAITKSRDKKIRWRLLDHVFGAIAALSQDVLVCVPKVVKSDVLSLLLPFLTQRKGYEQTSRVRTLQYHAVSIIRAIASYPFGEYHAYLVSLKGKHDDLDGSESLTLMDQIKKIGYDFASELRNRPTSSLDKPTVGELARETLAFINERQHQEPSKHSGDHERFQSGSQQLYQLNQGLHNKQKNQSAAFPELACSPVKREIRSAELIHSPERISPMCISSGRRLDPVLPASASPQGERGGPPELAKDAKSILTILIVDRSSPSKPLVNGVDIYATRPSDQSRPRGDTGKDITDPRVQISITETNHYVFARPKPKNKQASLTSCLMLDPLFQTKSSMTSATKLYSMHDGHQHEQRRRRTKDGRDEIWDDHELENMYTYPYSHEMDRYGHCVTVKARRQKKGDKYIPSLG